MEREESIKNIENQPALNQMTPTRQNIREIYKKPPIPVTKTRQKKR
jgi:hypothetical protein